MRRSIRRIVCVALILLAGGEELFATDVGGLICTDTTWNLAGSPYIVTGSSGIVIGCNATLTIEPDVVVKFNPTLAIVVGSNAFGNGCLVARGTAESPIVFTSVKANNPLDPAKPGDWSRIHFTDYAGDAVFNPDGNYVSGCILEQVVVEYAGHGNYAAIFAEKSSPFLNYCEVRHNSYYGIQADDTSAPPINITNCEVWDNSQTGIYIANGLGHYLANNNVHHNGGWGIRSSGSGNTLTGNTITANFDGILLSYSDNCTVFGNTITNNAGYNGQWQRGGIFLDNCKNGTLIGNTISGNIMGIYLWYYSSGCVLSSNTISGNASGGIIIYLGSSGCTVIENVVSGNTGCGIESSTTLGPGTTMIGNTIIDNNSTGNGGGILCSGSSGNTLTKNTITGNSAVIGGGVYLSGSGSTLTSNIIQYNKSGTGLGTVYVNNSYNSTFVRNTITDNYINTGTTGGIYVTNDSEYLSLAGDPNTGTYNIIRDNDGYQVYNDNSFQADGRNDINAVYVQWGTCDIQEIMARIFDYFDDGSKAFVLFYPFVYPGDFDFDEDVDWLDLATFVENWLRQDCIIPDWCEGTDLDVNTTVDFFDFARFGEYWLECAGP